MGDFAELRESVSVLAMIAIANEMFIAVGTVKARIPHVYQKLGIHTRKELFELIGKDAGERD